MQSPLPSLTLGQKLHSWRTSRLLTQDDVGNMFRGVTGPTVGRWEKGQEIPGPVQILLEWLIDGVVPFQSLSVPQSIREEALKVTMNLEAWERLDALRIAGGYATVTDMIAVWIQEELSAKTPTPSEEGHRTSDHAPVDELAMLAEKESTYDAGGGGVGGGGMTAALDAAAKTFAAANPVTETAPAPGGGAGAGSVLPRGGVSYKRGTKLRGIRQGKR